MTISRATAVTYLHSSYSSLATEISQAATDDSATGYGPDIDNALRALDVAETALLSYAVADADRAKYFAAADYYALRRFVAQLATSGGSVQLGPQREDGSGMIGSLMNLLAQAKKNAEALGVTVEGGGWTVGTLTTDWSEPEYTAA